uniref:Uncharacterized protein n=1 Tax=Caenorhabditis japonica TaxID=281687 RepID=A0A8R1EUM9_CAEJA
MLGLTRGNKGANSNEQHFYFPEEDDNLKRNNNRYPELDKTFVRVIGTVAGREIIPRRWNENESDRRPIFDAEGLPLRQPPVISRVLGRPGGI